MCFTHCRGSDEATQKRSEEVKKILLTIQGSKKEVEEAVPSLTQEIAQMWGLSLLLALGQVLVLQQGEDMGRDSGSSVSLPPLSKILEIVVGRVRRRVYQAFAESDYISAHIYIYVSVCGCRRV